MSLHGGLDTVAITTGGVFTKTYGSTDGDELASLYVSRGYFENAPNITIKIINIVMSYFRRREE